MVNISFSKKSVAIIGNKFVLPKKLELIVKNENYETNIYEEYRTQDFYTKEIWLKLKSLGIKPEDLYGKNILDLCSGSGFLSYHILKRAKPASITLAEISPEETKNSKKLLNRIEGTLLNYINEDVLNIKNANNKYDIVIGNSFLHHLYDIPKSSSKFLKYLKPGGFFIILHEPTPPAVLLESANLKDYFSLLAKKNKNAIIDKYRYGGPGFVERPFGGDVWYFESHEIIDLFMKSGYKDVKVVPWHLLRPVLVAIKSIHLSRTKPKMTKNEKFLLRLAIAADNVLNKILPASFFGSFSLIAKK